MILKLVRWFLGKLILIADRAFPPKAISRNSAEQAEADREAAGLALYQFEACPFCVKVRRAVKRLGLKIELRDVLKNPIFQSELVREGGMVQVPCLRIPQKDGMIRWLYESDDIIRYLEERFVRREG